MGKDRTGAAHDARKAGAEVRGPFHPSWALIGFFALLVAAGTLLLYLPAYFPNHLLNPVAGQDRVSFLDALFTATSAATGTGLVVQDTASYWNSYGHRVIFGLFQIGGLGSLVGSTIFLLLIIRRVSKEERSLFRSFMGVESGRGLLFLVLGITVYALIIEAAGTYLLARQLSASMLWDEALWKALFHAASAFNNAGFEFMGMGSQQPATQTLLILGGLSFLGGISFIVVVDLARGLFRHPLSLDTKLVLLISVLLVAGGAGLILLTEWNSAQSLGAMSVDQKVLSAFFHSVSTRTAGLASVDISAFAQSTILLLAALMFIGGSSGSTAGGLKVNTLAILAAVTWSFVRGKREVTALGSIVHEEQVYRAMAIAFLSLAMVFVVTLLLGVIEGPGLLPQMFEAISAFSTTGLSLNTTPTLSPAGKLLIILTMFVGRVGPLTLAFALASRRRPTRQVYAEEAINLG
ncbi:MAG: hypothetical protein HYU29_02965 [Chloroflexi bacterium]|nr:hypothetical protein [Chloroflexota bacterium]